MNALRALLPSILLAGSTLPGATFDSVNDAARFLAGLPSAGGKGSASLRQTAAWQEHSRQMDNQFNRFRETREQPISSWRNGALRGLPGRTVFYPFGGPDYLFARALFPDAGTCILVGLEGADPLPSFAKLDETNVGAVLANLRKSLSSVIQLSFFITKDMRTNLASTQLRGSLPLVLVFAARGGYPIHSVELIDLSRDGSVVSRSGSGGAAPGFRIQAGRKTIYYFQEDLSNGGVGSDRRLLRFVSSQAPFATFLKSASYLMHQGEFTAIRNYILENSAAVVTDPSGIPFRSLDPNRWKIQLYGSYNGPIDMFKSYSQPDLTRAYTSGQFPVGALPFGVGYKQTSLVVARAK
jgi:hypothetical protein